MILGGWIAEVWILMEKKAFRCNFAKIRKIPEKYGNNILPEDEGSQKEGRRWASGGPHPLGAGPPCPAPRVGVAHLIVLRLRPLDYIFLSEP